MNLRVTFQPRSPSMSSVGHLPLSLGAVSCLMFQVLFLSSSVPILIKEKAPRNGKHAGSGAEGKSSEGGRMKTCYEEASELL